jgi:hypothetical protein
MHQSYTSNAVFLVEKPSGELIVKLPGCGNTFEQRDLRCLELAQYSTRFKRAKEHKNASS